MRPHSANRSICAHNSDIGGKSAFVRGESFTADLSSSGMTRVRGRSATKELTVVRSTVVWSVVGQGGGGEGRGPGARCLMLSGLVARRGFRCCS